MIRWRVGTKIISIGIIVLIAFAAIAGFYSYQSRQVDALLVEDREATAHVERTAKTRDFFLKARIAERNFDESPDARHAQATGQMVAGAQAELREMETSTVQPDEKREVTAAIDALAAYAQRFEALRSLWERLGYNENSGLQGSLRKAVHEIETALGSSAPELSALMLTLRRNEKDFILRRDRSYLERFEKNADIFRAALEKDGRTAQLQLLATYRRDFAALVEGTLAVRGANAVVSIDLDTQEIKGPDGGTIKFEVDAFRKHCLLNGLDDIALTLEKKPSMDDFEMKNKLSQPWLWN